LLVTTDEETHADRKRRVESVVGAIELNTGGPRQPSDRRAGIRIAHLLGNRTRAGVDRRDTERALRAAVEREAVVAYRDAEGMTRYAVADAVGLRAVALACGMDAVADALNVPVLADVEPDADAVGQCIDAHIGGAIGTDDLPQLNALQQGLREGGDD
jgi:hypothetical protein